MYHMGQIDTFLTKLTTYQRRGHHGLVTSSIHLGIDLVKMEIQYALKSLSFGGEIR